MKSGRVFCNRSNFPFTLAFETSMSSAMQCPLFVACDKPRASEFCHHMGSSAIYFCRVCEVSCDQVFL